MDTSIVILPQRVLSNQICSECCNYLSVGPVMVCQGKKICGRCTLRDSKEKACVSLYDKIAENCIFKCVNHYSGCKEVLAYNEAIDHEKTCKKEDLKCLHCEFKGNGCQLVHHVKKKHPNNAAEDNVFPILLQPSSYNFMFAENDDLLFMKFTENENIFNVQNLLVKHDDNSDFEYFELQLFSPNSPVQYITPKVRTNLNQKLFQQQRNFLPLGPIKNCFPSRKCLVKVNVMRSSENILKQVKCLQKSIKARIPQKSLQNPPKIVPRQVVQNVKKEYLLFDQLSMMDTAELKKFVCTKLFDLQLCVNCCKYLTNIKKIYYCLNHHMVCKSCIYEKCGKCNAFSQWNKYKFDHLSLECDWEGCGANVNICNFLSHKQRCPHRQYQCPGHNCRYSACLKDFKKHWHLSPYINASDIDFYGSCAYYCFILSYNELGYVTVEWSDDTVTVNVNEEQVVLNQMYDVEISYRGKRSRYKILPQQKWVYTSVARTMTAQIPTDCNEEYLSLCFFER